MTISVKSPVRAAVLLTTVAVVVVLLLAHALAAPEDLVAAGQGGQGKHLVVTGDTLWDIAAGYTPPGEDVRRTVEDIRRANGLEGSLIYPGQVLQIPGGA
jgi:LysM repeat protein